MTALVYALIEHNKIQVISFKKSKNTAKLAYYKLIT